MTTLTEDEKRKRDLRQTEDERRQGVLSDKEQVRVPMMLMDNKSKQTPPPFHYGDARPQAAALDDAERERRQGIYEAADKRLSEAWKQGAAVPGGDE